jgi:hypothetical protein
MITLISSKKLGVCNNMRNTVLGFQFLEDLETLGQLGEDIKDTVVEVEVLDILLELKIDC